MHPYIYTFDFKSIGYPLGIFYPDLTLIPFAIMNLLFHNIVISTLCGIVFYNFLTLCVTHWMTYKITYNNLQSFFTAFLYTFSLYRIIDIWTRFALGEFICLTFLPLVLYGLYSILFENYKDWPYLAFGLSLTMLTHVLSTYIDIVFCIFVGLFALFFMKKNQFHKRILALCKSGLIFILSSSVFIVPFIEQEITGNYSQPAPMKVSFYASPFFNVFKSMLNNNLIGNYNWNRDEVFSVGLIGLIIIIIGALNFRKFNSFEKIILLISIMLIVIQTNIIPWSLFDNISLIDVIQFPFRDLGIASLLLSYLGGKEIVWAITFNSNQFMQATSILITIILIIIPWFSSINNWKMVNKNVYTIQTIKRSMASNDYSTLNLNDYTVHKGRESLKSVSEKHLGKIDDKNYYFTKIKSCPNSIEYTNLKVKKDQKIMLPFYNMTNIEVLLEGKKQNISTAVNGLITFNATRKSNSIIVRYKPSIIDNLSIVISLLTWLLFFCSRLIKIKKID